MSPLSPALVLAVATAMMDDVRRVPLVLEDVDDLDRERHRPHDPMATAAFVNHVGYRAHLHPAGGSAWPFPIDADCDALAELAARAGVLSVGAPERGAIYLRWSRVELRFTRASFVVWAADMPGSQWSYDCLAIIGRAGESPVRGIRSARYERVRCSPSLGDRFVDWMSMPARGAVRIEDAA